MFIKRALLSLASTFVLASSVSANELGPTYYTFELRNHFVNAYSKVDSGNVNMWPTADLSDSHWNWYGTDNLVLAKFGEPYGQSYPGSFCLNAHNPSPTSNVDIYTCDLNDPEQHWDIISAGSSSKKMIKLKNTSLCLNSYRTAQGSNVNLYTCNSNDPDQLWTVNNIVIPLP